MNIQNFITYLNKRNGWQLEGRFYSTIEEWKRWWEGYYERFHQVKEAGLDERIHARTMYRLKMPKRICEDWASLLLGDSTKVTAADKAASEWLCGAADSQQTGGVLGKLDFWTHANELVELAFRSGTGAFVLRLRDIPVQGVRLLPSPSAVLELDYLPAEYILPLSVHHGSVTEAAFVSEVTVHGKSCVYLETHRLVKRSGGGQEYQITNEYFASNSEDADGADYKPIPLPEGMLAQIRTGSPLPWFSLFSPAGVKNIPGGPGLGMAVFSEAIDAAKMVDLAFDNYCRDLYLGGKKVFYSKNLLKPIIQQDGTACFAAPDHLRQQLFWQTGDTNPDSKAEWHEYNPDLRVEANSRAVQDALDYTSFKAGLGTRRYQFNAGAVTTATQYNGERNDMVQNANRHHTRIEAALLRLFRSMLWIGRNLMQVSLDADTELSINWDDSYITSTEDRRAMDRSDAEAGFWPKYRYNMEWRGMSEEEARAAVREAQEESRSQEALTFGELG